MSKTVVVLEQLAHEEQLAELSRQLAQVNRVAHDARGQLQTVLGYAQLLVGQPAGQLTEKQYGYVQKIQAGASEMLAFIKKLDEIKVDNQT
jgi:light-regulated signal transduction histidine kinase (bacteriophytochrome)